MFFFPATSFSLIFSRGGAKSFIFFLLNFCTSINPLISSSWHGISGAKSCWNIVSVFPMEFGNYGSRRFEFQALLMRSKADDIQSGSFLKW